jgi:hypothetical protein
VYLKGGGPFGEVPSKGGTVKVRGPDATTVASKVTIRIRLFIVVALMMRLLVLLIQRWTLMISA